jgi:hypothetical protein
MELSEILEKKGIDKNEFEMEKKSMISISKNGRINWNLFKLGF